MGQTRNLYYSREPKKKSKTGNKIKKRLQCPELEKWWGERELAAWVGIVGAGIL